MTPAIILDVLIAAILLTAILRGSWRGLFLSLSGVIVLLLTIVGANLGAKALTPPVADWATPKIEEKIAARVEKTLEERTQEQGRTLEELLPDSLRNLLNRTGLMKNLRSALERQAESTIAATAKAIARKAGIAHVISDVLPTDKAGAVGKLQAEGHRVLMVGDGINDAPALVSADVGMAIGAGTDIAIESADVVLMTGSLAAVSGAVELSKATIRNIRQNLFWAFFYNTLGIPLAAGVLFLPLGLKLSPMFGAAAMSLSSVFVVTNALRLRLFKPKTSHSVVEAPKHEEIKTKEDTIMKTVIKVNGMMCGHCKAHVETACKGVPGVTDAVVDLDAKNVTVTGDADVAALKKAITDAGYEVVE